MRVVHQGLDLVDLIGITRNQILLKFQRIEAATHRCSVGKVFAELTYLSEPPLQYTQRNLD